MKQHAALDSILSFLLKNKGSSWISAYGIQQELFPDAEHQVIEYYLQLICNHPANPPIVDASKGNVGIIVTANALTKQFLEKGGFTALAGEEAEKTNQHDELMQRQVQKMNLEIENLVNTVADY